MITKITGEQPFQVLTNNFSISPSNEGYTLQISADGKQYSNLFTVGAGVTRLVTGVAANSYYRLSGNQSNVSINWMKVCVTEGGGEASGTELSPVSEFPAGAEAGTVIAYSGSSSAAGIYQFDGTDWVAAGGSVNLSAYWTSAETQSAITAVEDQLFDVEEVTASALTELHDDVLELSASTAGKADAANVTPKTGRNFPEWNAQGIITGSTEMAWLTSDIVNGKVRKQVLSNDTSNGFAIYAPESAGTAGDILVSAGANQAPVWSAVTFPDVSNYVTSADVETQIEAKGYITSADTADFLDAEDGLVISTALNNLDDRVDEVETQILEKNYVTSAQVETQILEKNYITSAATANMVTSTSVSTIWKGTAAEYEAITVKDPTTFYIIVSSN